MSEKRLILRDDVPVLAFDFCDPPPLRCPYCYAAYLHHTYVVCYDRAREDGKTTAIHIENGNIVPWAVSSIKHNPSSRRDGIAIGFYCENCHGEPELTIAQHKGNTEMGWREKTLPQEQMFPRLLTGLGVMPRRYDD
jgi:hypothetical protein